MPKRKKQSTDDFFKVAGISGVSDAAIRQVLQRLRGEPVEDTRSSGLHVRQRFPELQHWVKEHDCGLVTLDLQQYMDKACAVRPDFLELFRGNVLVEQKKHGAVQGVLYCDEAVPGNIIAPDNKRRSYCFYFCPLPLCKFRQETFWVPYGLIRSEHVTSFDGGLPAVFTVLLEELTCALATLVVDHVFINTDRLLFLGDEDALKKCAGHKGASGLRPCIKCANCISKGNEVAGYFAISEVNWQNFIQADDSAVHDLLLYLERLHANDSRATFEENEKLSGWKWSPEMWAMKQPLWSMLKPSDFVYDDMHNYFSNGIVGMELGLFLEAALTKTTLTRQDLEAAILASAWKGACGLLDNCDVKQLFNAKLFKSGADYKGDASQTLSLLPLMTYIAASCLVGFPAIKNNVDSLIALNLVVNCIVQCKQQATAISDLLDLQQKHLNCFHRAYGVHVTRPKHHFAFHTVQQVLAHGILLDTFVTERKNKTFKAKIAPKLLKLHGFARSVLLRWIEIDLERLRVMTFPGKALDTPFKKQPFQNVTLGRSLRHDFGEFQHGHVLLFADCTAFFVIAAFESEIDGLGLVVQALHKIDSGPGLFWSKWKLTDSYLTMPLDKAIQHVRTSWYSVDEAEQTLLLLRG